MSLFLSFLGLFFGLNLISDSLIIFIIIIIITFLFVLFRFDKKKLILFSTFTIIGILLSLINIKISPQSGNYFGVVIESKDNYFIFYSKFQRFIVYEVNNKREVGDFLVLKGSISAVTDTSLESEFSFADFLKNKGITNIINFTEVEVKFSNFIKIKAFKSYFLNLFDEKSRLYISIFLFNTKGDDSVYKELISSLMLTYIFSSTGIYLSFLFSSVEYLFFLKFDRKKSRIFTLLLLSFRILLSLNKVSLRRILYLKIFSLINEYKLKNKFSYIESISLIGIIMLILNRFLARQDSFYIGIFISISLYFLKDTLKENKKINILSKSSIFIFLFTLPICLRSNAFHLFSYIFGIMLLPISGLFSLSATIALYTYPIKPYFSFLSEIINNLLIGIDKIDIVISFRNYSKYYILIYYFILFLIFYFEESHEKKKKILCISLSLSMIVFKIIPINYLYSESISFINVGQGDCALLRYKNKSIMIDTGGLTNKDIANDVTIPYMRKFGINKLDYVFISHSDYDHSGALSSLKNNFRIDNIIDSSDIFTVTINDLVIENINKWANDFEDINDKSQVLKFRFMEKNFLMMGDVSTSVEKKIISEYSNLNIDILKLGHHGSKTSSSYEFLKEIKPKTAIISVGKNNKYKHPNKEVIDNLEILKIPYFRTDINGTICFDKYSFLNFI